jgi:hypothetical protein
MPKLIINNNTYNYPDAGSEAGWGKDATDWASDVTEQLASLAGTGTITETQANIQLNVASPEEIPGLLFSPSLIESAEVTYRIYRTTDSEELSEQGTLSLVYISSDPLKWFMSRTINAGTDAKVILDINVNGQVTYTSSPLSGSNYTGYIKFKTSAILRT